MIPYKLIIKLFAQADTFEPAAFVPVFHRWIQDQALPGHLLIDVADYAHVPDGPGTLLVTSQANVHVDREGGHLGMAYVRKLPVAGAATFEQTFHAILAHALTAASLLEQDPALQGRLRFRTGELSVRFNDRLLTPNTPETVADYQPHVLAGVAKVYPGQGTTVTPHNTSPRQLLDLRVTSPDAPPLSALISRVTAV